MNAETTEASQPVKRQSKKKKAAATIVTPARYVTIPLAAAMFGLTAGAIRKRIERGQWVERREWRRGEDGRLWINVRGVEESIERGSS